MRILHFSDLHWHPRFASVPLADWPGKRIPSALNLVLRRRSHFSDVPRKLEKLTAFAREYEVDSVLFTGDYTLWGTEHEFAAARRAVQPLVEVTRQFVTVPGNHDLFTASVVREGRFLRHFHDFLESDMPESASDGPWPLVRWLGNAAVAIAVNSSQPHRVFWRASGRIPETQLEALRHLVAHPRVRNRFAFVMTHHAPRLADGRPDGPCHGLSNAEEFLEICSGIEHGAILFGHVHRRYRLDVPGLDAPLFNAGSATMNAREGFWLFDVAADSVQVRQGAWDGDRYRLQSAGDSGVLSKEPRT